MAKRQSNEILNTNLAKKVKFDIIKLSDLCEQFNKNQLQNLKSWTILAKITFKGQITSWENKKGHGQKINFCLIDDSKTELNCIAFNEDAVFYDKLLNKNDLYYIKNAKAIANKLNNKLELHFSKTTTEVEQYHGDLNFDLPSLSTLKICEILKKKDGDLIGKIIFKTVYFLRI